jgi:hypothetical protein
MARQAQAARLVALVMSVPRVMHARRVTTASVVQHVPLVMTVRLVMTVHLARIAPIAHLAMNLRSAMVAPFAKDATSTPRASLIAPSVRRVMSDVTTVPFVMTVHLVPIVLFVTIGPHATTAVPFVTTAHRALTETIGRSALLVTIVVMTAVPCATTAVPAPIAPPATTVPPAVTRTSTPRVTRRRSTSPATMSYSSVFRRWRPLLTTSTV